MAPADDHEEIVARVAACDIGKAELTCCVRVPGGSGRSRRVQQVQAWVTTTPSLNALADDLAGMRVSRVVMESTSDYWKPVYYLLEARGFDVWLVNARDVKHVPGRAKTDTQDAVWLAKLAERQMLRPSFVPERPIRQLRDLTRYRSDVVVARTAEKQRVEKLLEDAQLKLSVVASDIFGVSGRAMMAALIDGTRDPLALAQLAHGRLRTKHSRLVEALTGFFTEHHAFLLGRMLARIDALTADIEALDEQIDRAMVPFEQARTLLTDIPGFGRVTAAAVLGEIGVDMGRFPTAGHLTSWAKLTPQTHQSGGKPARGGATGRGNRYLARALGEVALSAGKTSTYLGERHRRYQRRMPPSKVIVATSRHILGIIWHVLSNPEQPYYDLGTDYHQRRTDSQRQIRNHIHQLHTLGVQVTVEPHAA